MKYARIINSIAVDTRVDSPEAYFTPNIAAEFVQVPDTVQDGWIQTGSDWAAPPPPPPYVPPPYVPPPAPPEIRHITRLAFRNRFTSAEKVTLEIASLDTPAATMAQRQQAAGLRVALKDQENASYIDLDNAATRAGVQMLEAAGLMAAGRALEVLDAPVVEAEKFKG